MIEFLWFPANFR